MRASKNYKRITVNWHKPNGEPLAFDIFTDSSLEHLEEPFIDWMLKTRIYTPESFCRYVKKRYRKISILSIGQYINYTLKNILIKN